MSKTNDLRIAAVNRHRKQLFGDSSLKVYSVTPAAGDTLEHEFTTGWFAHRVRPTTSGLADTDDGAWQFQAIAAENWAATQAFMTRITALTVGTRRWKITKIEEPIGLSLVWKIRAEVEK